MCEAAVKELKPAWGHSAEGTLLKIINTENFPQKIRMEVCRYCKHFLSFVQYPFNFSHPDFFFFSIHHSCRLVYLNCFPAYHKDENFTSAPISVLSLLLLVAIPSVAPYVVILLYLPLTYLYCTTTNSRKDIW